MTNKTKATEATDAKIVSETPRSLSIGHPRNAATLFAVADEYLADVAKLADLDLDEQTIADTLEGMAGELEAKATNVALFLRTLEGNADQIREAEKALAARRKAIEKRAENLSRYILETMLRTGIKKIEGPALKISHQLNPAKVVIDDEGAIPPSFWRQPPPPEMEIDKAAIKEAIEEHQRRHEAAQTLKQEFFEPHPVPGARIVREPRLVIKH